MTNVSASDAGMQISGASEHSHNNDKARNSSPAAAAGQIHVQQQPNMIKNICQPLVDRVKLWEEVAGVEYAADGDVQGWHTAAAAAETSEDKYMKVRTPSVQRCHISAATCIAWFCYQLKVMQCMCLLVSEDWYARTAWE